MILSSDAHAGAPLPGYRDFLPARWHDDFDRWVAAVRNPWHDASDTRNWDSGDRLAAMDAEGITGELLFPNTLPPFYDTQAHLSGVPRSPEQFAQRWAGLQAHNRWVVAFCEQLPERRRAVIQLLPNDVEAAVAELRWAAEQYVVGGVMLPAVPPNHVVAPYFDLRYEPLWAAAAELGVPIHHHSGSGSPDLPDQPVARSIFFVNSEVWTQLTLSHLIVGGVFDRHPALRFVWTELPGVRWVLEQLERIERGLGVVQHRHAGDTHQLNYAGTFGSETVDALELSPLDYFRRNCYLGASLLSPHDVPYLEQIGLDRVMWGHDGPHAEGSGGFTEESLRANFAGFSRRECELVLTDTAAELYHFDVAALRPVADRIGPTAETVARPLDQLPPTPGSAFWPQSPLRQVLDRGAAYAASAPELLA